MTTRSSTLRSTADATVGQSHSGPRPLALQQLITAQWLKSGRPDLVHAIQQHPQLLTDRSLLLNLAIEEYQAQRKRAAQVDLEGHCRRFREFGSSIERSIFRQLETQRYIDKHPELLEFLQYPRWPEVGESFGTFRIVEDLGSGAIARVYLCRQTDVGDRLVVVKATPFSGIEASVLGRLDHPNITPIHSAGVVEERQLHYLCMPYCGRSTLNDVLDIAFDDGVYPIGSIVARAASRWSGTAEQPLQFRRGQLFKAFDARTYIGDVLTLAIQIADALAHAHRQGILHGDLKPSNVLLTPKGKPLLLDFNLSRDLTASTGAFGGTLLYMAPECLEQVACHDQSHTDVSTLNDKVDIYSFGALVYELLAGITPVTFSRNDEDPSAAAHLLLRRLRHGIPPIRAHNPLVSRRLESVILSCLAFDSQNRPASMAQVRTALEQETGLIPSVARQARVRPKLFATIVVLLLATVVGSFTYLAAQPPRHVAEFQKGLHHFEQGDFPNAMAHLEAAVAANTRFAPARFHLGRTRVALGQLDLAIGDFDKIARAADDSRSMAYLGYCFSLMKLHVAAIPWYERAIQHGEASLPVYNNLGAAYLDILIGSSPRERVERSQELLNQALAMDQASLTVQLNLVRLESAKARLDPSHSPAHAWRHARAVLEADPEDPFVHADLLSWYSAVREYESRVDHSGAATEYSSSLMDTSSRRLFDQLLAGVERRGNADAADSSSVEHPLESSSISSLRRYYLEPTPNDPH